MPTPFEIKDLAGLSKPLVKLIEVTAKGCGAVSGPFLIRANAKAKAKEIKEIGAAVHDVYKNNGVPVKYEDGKITMVKKSDPSLVYNGNIQDRTMSRVLFQEQKRQDNLEIITSIAAVELQQEDSVLEETVDEDWITRFFDTAQDISNEEMQSLWGKILSGEIKRPGTYSLRTLDALRNITKEEADLFVKVSQYAIQLINTDAIIPDQFVGNINEKAFISYSDLFKLSELNFINITSTKLENICKKGEKDGFIHSNKVLIITPKKEDHSSFISCYKYTPIGAELLNLIEIHFNDSLVQEFANLLKDDNLEIFSANIISKDEKGFPQYSVVKKI